MCPRRLGVKSKRLEVFVHSTSDRGEMYFSRHSSAFTPEIAGWEHRRRTKNITNSRDLHSMFSLSFSRVASGVLKRGD